MCYFSEHIVLSILQKFWQSDENQESCRDFVTPPPKFENLPYNINTEIFHYTIGLYDIWP